MFYHKIWMLDSSKCILVATFQVFPTIFFIHIFALVFLGKAVFKDSRGRVNVNYSAWLAGYDGYIIYLFQLLTFLICTFFSFLGTLFFWRNLGFHTNVGGVWLLLPKKMLHFIAENSDWQKFIFGVEWN